MSLQSGNNGCYTLDDNLNSKLLERVGHKAVSLSPLPCEDMAVWLP